MATPLYDAPDKQPTVTLGGDRAGGGTSGASAVGGTPRRDKADAKSPAAVASELWDLLKRYAKQETVDPLKGIGRFLALGTVGSLLLATGVIFLGLGVLRLLQTETDDHLTGSLNWIPYLAALALAALLMGMAVAAIARAAKKGARAGQGGGR